MNKEHQKFTPNYEELKQIAEQLRVQKEINIDELIPMIERATKAYNICKERLEAVKVALEKYMPPNNEEQTVN
jgi:exodeoxyribonuclease VII small subunit